MTGTCPHGWTFAHNCPTQPAPDLSDHERGVVERIEGAPAAEESFDAVAALRRVEAVADEWGADTDARYSANRIAKSTAARVLRDVLDGTT